MTMAFAVLSLLDILTTLYVGFEFEMNPVVASMGVTRWIVVKVLLVLCFDISTRLFRSMWPVLKRYYVNTAIGISATVVMWNLRSIVLWAD